MQPLTIILCAFACAPPLLSADDGAQQDSKDEVHSVYPPMPEGFPRARKIAGADATKADASALEALSGTVTSQGADIEVLGESFTDYSHKFSDFIGFQN